MELGISVEDISSVDDAVVVVESAVLLGGSTLEDSLVDDSEEDSLVDDSEEDSSVVAVEEGIGAVLDVTVEEGIGAVLDVTVS